MGSNDDHEQMSRRSFLAAASGAVIASSVVAGGWDDRATAEVAPVPAADTAPFQTGVVEANGLQFHYLEAGQGPLALCLHGFPDSPFSYRYLMPALAQAG
ncbi:MAG: hypothetical protein QOF96_2574, partial [Actinomycetota bacterium]|nr:hypothetical protein [Actinomycetota bacterium]